MMKPHFLPIRTFVTLQKVHATPLSPRFNLTTGLSESKLNLLFSFSLLLDRAQLLRWWQNKDLIGCTAGPSLLQDVILFGRLKAQGNWHEHLQRCTAKTLQRVPAGS